MKMGDNRAGKMAHLEETVGFPGCRVKEQEDFTTTGALKEAGGENCSLDACHV